MYATRTVMIMDQKVVMFVKRFVIVMDNIYGVIPIVILVNPQHKKRFLVHLLRPLKHIRLLLQTLALELPPILLHKLLRKQEPLAKLPQEHLQEQPPILVLVPLQIPPLKHLQEPLVKHLQELHRILLRELHPIQEPLHKQLHALPHPVLPLLSDVVSFTVLTPSPS